MWGSCTSPPSNQESKIGKGWEGSGCPVIVRGTTLEYRRALAAVVQADDICVEIGSASGVTSMLLARTALRVVGVDSSSIEVEGAIKNARSEGFLASSLESSKDELESTPSVLPPSLKSNATTLEFIVAKVHQGDKCEGSLAPLVATLQRHNGHTLSDITLLAVDIAGTAPVEWVAPLVVTLRRLMKPRVTVVKNLALKKLLVAMEAGESLISTF